MIKQSSQIKELLTTPISRNCINSALLVAIKRVDPSSVCKLILYGAINIDAALALSRELQQHAITVTLIIIKACMENDKTLVLKLYGEKVQAVKTKVSQTEDELQVDMYINQLQTNTKVFIEVSRMYNALAVREELLLRTQVYKNSGVVLWNGLHLTQLEISWLRKIYWVKELILASNELMSLPLEMGNYLKECTKLDLQSNRICQIPSCLLELPSINELNLSHNNIIDIPDVPEWSASLSVLDLSYNHLSNLPNSAVSPTLKNLNISNNQFHTVPHCVCSFVSLTILNIANNPKILTLPFELGQLKNLFDLNLDGLNNLNDPPKSVRVTTANCIQYLNNCLHSAHGYYHMKMMLVGKHAVGKSTIVARLRNKEIGNESTVGIKVSKWNYAPAYNQKTFHFRIWDFAGQEEYYATHQCFLSKYSLYLLVWNITEGDDGVADLKPWLNSISLRAPDSCIMVVGTFLDKVSEEDQQSGKISALLRKVEELTRQYHRLIVAKIIVVGLKGRMENVAKLKDYIYNAAAEYKIKNQYVMGRTIPSSYHALDNRLSKIHHLVKKGHHKAIMHATEFQKMVRDQKLLDIQDDHELHKATQFLHEVGALLHYDDRKHNLDELYFVDPRWLCELLSTVVNVKQQNPYMKQGILRSKNIPTAFKDKHLPNEYFNQYLTLLIRFEIVLPLDKYYKRVLIPSLLPKKRPGIVAELHLDETKYYKRFILFGPSMAKGQAHCCPTPPGFWSHLLSCILNTAKDVRNILDKQIPVEEDLVVSSNISHLPSSNSTTTSLFPSILENSLSSETFSMFSSDSNGFGRSFECSTPTAILSPNPSSKTVSEPPSIPGPSYLSCQESQGGSVEVLPLEGDGTLVYWCTGLFYNVNKLTFVIESLAELKRYQDKDGVLILASQGAEGCKMLGQLIDIVEQLISEWYPELNVALEQKVPCVECIKCGALNPHEFKVDQLLPLIVDNKLINKCYGGHEVKLVEIVPDLLLQDLDPVFLLDSREVIYKQEKESLLGTGTFGEMYCGKYRGKAVAIKLYKAKENIKIEEGFKKLRLESKILQRLYHPSIMCMVGVTIYPTMLLVLEEVSEGSLEIPLFKEQRAFSRIVLHRIAIQVASALHYLHSNNIIFRDLNAGNVLLCSRLPDHLINCKVTNLNTPAYADPRGVEGHHGTKGFIAPEVTYGNYPKEHSVYDLRAAIFSFGMFLYQLLARRHPFHNVQPLKIEAAIKEGQRPQLEDVTLAETGFYYLSRVMKLCWAGNPKDRPSSQQIVESLSASTVQLIISVVPVNNKYSIRNIQGCIVIPVLNKEVNPVTMSSELWIRCDGSEKAELSVFTTNTMVKISNHFVNQNQMLVSCMKQCGEYMWVAVRAGIENSVVDIFNKNTKKLIRKIEMKENAIVTCITNSDQWVYMGTMEGCCFAFPMDVATIQGNSISHYKCVSEYGVDGVALIHACLWVSAHNQIHFLNPETLKKEGVEKRTKNTDALVGKMMPSDNGEQMWSAHIKGIIMSVWNAHQRTHITDVDVGIFAEKRCHIDLRRKIITAMCTALDTVWIGLASGHIMVFGMNSDSPGELLTYFRPYKTSIRFLFASKYPGPCQTEECMMLCGGIKEVTDRKHKDEKVDTGEIIDTTGVSILWEVLPAKYMRQVQYLSGGEAWLNYSTIKKAMNETGFADSMKYCQSTMVDLSTTQDNTTTTSTFDYQQ